MPELVTSDEQDCGTLRPAQAAGNAYFAEEDDTASQFPVAQTIAGPADTCQKIEPLQERTQAFSLSVKCSVLESLQQLHFAVLGRPVDMGSPPQEAIGSALNKAVQAASQTQMVPAPFWFYQIGLKESVWRLSEAQFWPSLAKNGALVYASLEPWPPTQPPTIPYVETQAVDLSQVKLPKVSDALSQKQQDQAGGLAVKHAELWAVGNATGQTNVVTHQINTADAQCGPARHSIAQEQAIEKYIEEIRAADIIVKSKSSWGSCVVLVPKKMEASECASITGLSLQSLRRGLVYPLQKPQRCRTELSTSTSCISSQNSGRLQRSPLTDTTQPL
ncbi:hypothetical protein ABBQ38_012245 [Trebouxia sp. C0009 RCD-2024]